MNLLLSRQVISFNNNNISKISYLINEKGIFLPNYDVMEIDNFHQYKKRLLLLLLLFTKDFYAFFGAAMMSTLGVRKVTKWPNLYLIPVLNSFKETLCLYFWSR